MKQRPQGVEGSSSADERMAAVAHEIGTPMTTILGYAELLARSVGDEKNRQRAATIIEQVHRVSELTEELLALSRLPAGASRPVALDALLDASLAACAPAFERRGIRLQRRIAPTSSVQANPQRLQQAIVQLLLEAIEATPPAGTLLVSLLEQGGELEVRASQIEADGARSNRGGRFRLTLPVADVG